MSWIITKIFVTAALIVLITEVAKRSEKLGALITALPWVALLALVWMQLERQPTEKIGGYASYTFWYVLPTLPMFLLFPWLLERYGFWPSFGLSILLSVSLLGLLAFAIRPFGLICSDTGNSTHWLRAR